MKGDGNLESSDEYLDEYLHNNFYMELAMQVISNDETLRRRTVPNLKGFNSHFLSTQAKKGKLFFVMNAI